MSEVYLTDGRAGLRPADWLGLAAAPTFAILALFTGLSGGEALCAPSLDTSPLSGMTAMYALMAAFHMPPWLKLLGRRGGP